MDASPYAESEPTPTPNPDPNPDAEPDPQPSTTPGTKPRPPRNPEPGEATVPDPVRNSLTTLVLQLSGRVDDDVGHRERLLAEAAADLTALRRRGRPQTPTPVAAPAPSLLQTLFPQPLANQLQSLRKGDDPCARAVDAAKALRDFQRRVFAKSVGPAILVSVTGPGIPFAVGYLLGQLASQLTDSPFTPEEQASGRYLEPVRRLHLAACAEALDVLMCIERGRTDACRVLRSWHEPSVNAAMVRATTDLAERLDVGVTVENGFSG
jgi:hypothetical protein